MGIRWVDLTFLRGKNSCSRSKSWKATKCKKKQKNNVSSLYQHLWIGKRSTRYTMICSERPSLPLILAWSGCGLFHSCIFWETYLDERRISEGFEIVHRKTNKRLHCIHMHGYKDLFSHRIFMQWVTYNFHLTWTNNGPIATFFNILPFWRGCGLISSLFFYGEILSLIPTTKHT